MTEPTAPPKEEEIGTIGRARTLEQFELMQATVGQGICPFCDFARMRSTALQEGKYWIVRPNEFPYPHHRQHIVIIFKEHSKDNDIMAVTPEAWAEFGQMLIWVAQELSIDGGAVVMRFGDEAHNSSTIRHLHAHIQQPDTQQEESNIFEDDHGITDNTDWVQKSAFWKIKNKKIPYPHHRNHVIILFNEATGEIGSVSPSAWKELGELIARIIHICKMQGGGIVLRFGNPLFHGRLMPWLHVDIQEPDLTGAARAIFLRTKEKGILAKATFAKDPAKIASDAKRIEGFAKK